MSPTKTKTRNARDPRKPKSASAATRPPAGWAGTLTFVTGNAGKVAELTALAAPLGYKVVQDKRGYPEVQADSLAEVCQAGADSLLASGLKPPFLLEDSGLFVAALKGFPGVYSRHALDTIGVGGVLRLLRDVEAELRTAAFRTHLLYVDAGGRRHGFEGLVRGRIAARAEGSAGFGFDPIFVADATGVEGPTFAQLSAEAKNTVSHRGQAVRAFLAHLAK